MKTCHYHTFPAVCNAFFFFTPSFLLFPTKPFTTFHLVYGYIPGVQHLDLFFFYSFYLPTFHILEHSMCGIWLIITGASMFFLLIMYEKGQFVLL